MGFPGRVMTKKMVNFKATAMDWGMLQLLQNSISLHCTVAEALRVAIREACQKRNLKYRPPGLVEPPAGSIFAFNLLEPPQAVEVKPELPQAVEDVAAAPPAGKTSAARQRKPGKPVDDGKGQKKRKQNTAGLPLKKKGKGKTHAV